MPSLSYVIKISGTRVELYSGNGGFIRSITTGAKFAVLQGDEIHVTMLNNAVRIYALNGGLKRTI